MHQLLHIFHIPFINRAKTELNVVVGLCVGHDSLFYKYAEALTATAVTKDRVLGHNPAAVLYTQEIVDPETETKVEYEDGTVFEDTIELIVSPQTEDRIKEYAGNVEAPAKGLRIAELYDVKLLKNGVAIQPDGKIKISLKLTDKMKAMTNLLVVYIDDNGLVTIIPSDLAGDKIIFVTDHLSYYGFIGKETVSPEEPAKPPVPQDPSQPSSDKPTDTSWVGHSYDLLWCSGYCVWYETEKKLNHLAARVLDPKIDSGHTERCAHIKNVHVPSFWFLSHCFRPIVPIHPLMVLLNYANVWLHYEPGPQQQGQQVHLLMFHFHP